MTVVSVESSFVAEFITRGVVDTITLMHNVLPNTIVAGLINDVISCHAKKIKNKKMQESQACENHNMKIIEARTLTSYL